MKKIILISILLSLVFSSYSQDYKKRCDSLYLELKDKNFKINRIEAYISLCQKNPKLNKYFKGWVIRAVK